MPQKRKVKQSSLRPSSLRRRSRSSSSRRRRSCPKGKIRVASHKRTRPGGKRKSIVVKSKCVPDKGKPGRTPKSQRVLPKLTPGKLGKFGYSNVKKTSAKERRKALERAVKSDGYAPIIRRLNVIRTYNKNAPIFEIYDSDLKWMQRHLYDKYSLTAQRNRG